VAAATTAARASNGFGFDLFARVRLAGGNVIFSPASVAIALGMAQAGARGETAAEMAKTLHVDLIADAPGALGGLLAVANGLDGKEGLEVHVADEVWGQQGMAFEQDYLALLQKDFGAPVATVDFAGASGEAAGAINAWAAAKTHDRIPTIIDHPLNPMTRLVLTNAIYMKGKWQVPFPKAATKTEDFHTPARTVKVPMMTRHDEMAYASVDGVQVVELPYRGGLSMMVALPDAKDGLSAVEAQLARRYEGWRSALKSGRSEVDLKLPRWTMTWSAELTVPLQAMGMARAFAMSADFSGIYRPGGLAIASVLHKAFVEVNEEGTEAAGVTAIGVVLTSAVIRQGPVPVFHADHPFLYVIRERTTDAVLFMGHVVDPE